MIKSQDCKIINTSLRDALFFLMCRIVIKLTRGTDMDNNKIENTFCFVKTAMEIVGFEINYRGIPNVISDDDANTSHYLLKEHTVVLKDGYALAHELCHSLQTYETLSHNSEKGWFSRACEQQAMAIEEIEIIGLENTKLLINIIGKNWTSFEMYYWINYLNSVLKNRVNSKVATKPFHLPVSKRKALNALTDKINFGEKK